MTLEFAQAIGKLIESLTVLDNFPGQMCWYELDQLEALADLLKAHAEDREESCREAAFWGGIHRLGIEGFGGLDRPNHGAEEL